MSAARAEATERLTGCSVTGKRILVVGAGGIGCELVKNLVLSGFSNLVMIDLDTIDYSNLNRQFLFRAHHVGRSKAEVAREAVLEFPHDAALAIEAKHGNVKDAEHTLEYFKAFDLVLNGLDNIDARRHVNRLCFSAGVPLIESGTEGYLGQARAIVGGKTSCYECDPPEDKKETYPICTIRQHPDKPVHCISWSKELLFKELFSGEATDLVDADADAGEGAAEGGEGAEGAPPLPAPPKWPTLQDGEGGLAFAKRVFTFCFEEQIEQLLRLDELWKTRKAPVALRLSEMTLPDGKELLEVEQREWTVEESAAVFLESVRTIVEERADEVGSLQFDKDDEPTLNVVAAASNLRSSCFHIVRLPKWNVKKIAGAIIPAIATTNAIIAGFIVLEAFKILSGRLDDCRYCRCNRILVGRKRDTLLQGTALDPPNKRCLVCGTGQRTLVLDTSVWTVGRLIEQVFKKGLSFHEPSVYIESIGGDKHDQLCQGDFNLDVDDEEDAEKYARYAAMTLDSLPVPGVSGARLKVDDESQALNKWFVLRHETLDDEEVPSGFKLVGEDEAEAQGEEAAEGEDAGGAGDKRARDDTDSAGPAKKSKGAAAADAVVDADEDEDGAILLD